jgi:hypothetical protein
VKSLAASIAKSQGKSEEESLVEARKRLRAYETASPTGEAAFTTSVIKQVAAESKDQAEAERVIEKEVATLAKRFPDDIKVTRAPALAKPESAPKAETVREKGIREATETLESALKETGGDLGQAIRRGLVTEAQAERASLSGRFTVDGQSISRADVTAAGMAEGERAISTARAARAERVLRSIEPAKVAGGYDLVKALDNASVRELIDAGFDEGLVVGASNTRKAERTFRRVETLQAQELTRAQGSMQRVARLAQQGRTQEAAELAASVQRDYQARVGTLGERAARAGTAAREFAIGLVPLSWVPAAQRGELSRWEIALNAVADAALLVPFAGAAARGLKAGATPSRVLASQRGSLVVGARPTKSILDEAQQVARLHQRSLNFKAQLKAAGPATRTRLATRAKLAQTNRELRLAERRLRANELRAVRQQTRAIATPAAAPYTLPVGTATVLAGRIASASVAAKTADAPNRLVVEAETARITRAFPQVAPEVIARAIVIGARAKTLPRVTVVAKTLQQVANQPQVRAIPAVLPSTATRVSPATRAQTQPTTQQQTTTTQVVRTSEVTPSARPSRTPTERRVQPGRPSRLAEGKPKAPYRIDIPGRPPVELPAGKFPREVEWKQGLVKWTFDLDTGRRKTTRTTKPGSPADTFRVTRMDDTPPNQLSINMGIVRLLVNEGGLRFTRRQPRAMLRRRRM